MKKLIKRLTALMLCLLLCLSVCGCDNSNNTDNGSDDETVEIKLWFMSGSLSQSYLEQLVDKFNASQDNYWVVIYNNGNFSAIRTKLETTQKKSDYPDLFCGQATATCYYDNAEYVMPVQKYIDADEENWTAGIYENVKNTYTNTNGEFVGFPLGVSCSGYWVNVDALKEAGYTLDDMTSYEKIAQIAQDVVSKGICQYGLSTLGTGVELMDMLTLQGVDYVDADNGLSGAPSESLLLEGDTYAAYQKAASIYADLVDKGVMLPHGTDCSTECWPLYNSGDLAMLYATNSWAHYVFDGQPEFEYAFVPAVGLDENAKYQDQAIVEGTGLFMTNTENEAKMQGAYEFIKFMAQPENQSQYCQLLGYVPYTDEAYNQADYQQWIEEKMPSVAEIRRKINNASADLRTPYVEVFDEMLSVTNTLYSYLSDDPKCENQTMEYYLQYAAGKLTEGLAIWLERQ